jgi:hypothetical protein
MEFTWRPPKEERSSAACRPVVGARPLLHAPSQWRHAVRGRFDRGLGFALWILLVAVLLWLGQA